MELVQAYCRVHRFSLWSYSKKDYKITMRSIKKPAVCKPMELVEAYLQKQSRFEYAKKHGMLAC